MTNRGNAACYGPDPAVATIFEQGRIYDDQHEGGRRKLTLDSDGVLWWAYWVVGLADGNKVQVCRSDYRSALESLALELTFQNRPNRMKRRGP